MRSERFGIACVMVATLALAGGCLPLHCSRDEEPVDYGAPVVYDLSVGEIGRPLGTPCKSVDECNRAVADTCGGRCQCGSDGPCVGGQHCCGGRCVDTDSDPQNCGGCGLACTSGVCVGHDLGVAHCACDADADAGSGCGGTTAYEPSCGAGGECACGASAASCAPPLADGCGANGCSCASGPACGTRLVDHCESGSGCRCGTAPACDPALATGCDPTQTQSPCRCANGPGCSPGTFCCTQNSTCCGPSQFCCLDGCCNHPCLVFGFCAQ
jgi:hypothetical protein